MHERCFRFFLSVHLSRVDEKIDTYENFKTKSIKLDFRITILSTTDNTQSMEAGSIVSLGSHFQIKKNVFLYIGEYIML